MRSRFHLMNSGLYPETLPPCFVSRDAKRAFHGIVSTLDAKKFQDRKTEFVRYNGTKHDGSRRFFGTPNIITYFHISSFIWRHWAEFESNYNLSRFSIGKPKTMSENADRAIKVPSLSELSKHASENLHYAPYILKADIAQCFPSLYTHSISWAAHGIAQSKKVTAKDSLINTFNALDFFVRNGQQGNTRGVLVGPDAYRLIAEFVLSRLDDELHKVVGNMIIGAVRHVDDYYIGLKTEHDAQSVLSHLREVLASYELNLNDQKTKIYSSLEPINDLWAQRLRDHMGWSLWELEFDKLERAISEAVATAVAVGSDSPLKILFRAFDEQQVYNTQHWKFIERYMQRIIQKHAHAIDYGCLLVAKRAALGREIDKAGWLAVAEIIVARSLALDHHHETVWMVWLLIVCDIEIPRSMLADLEKSRNGHIRALIIQAYVDGKIKTKPKVGLGAPLQTTDTNWLVNLVARSQGFSKASFSGAYSAEFEHLAKRQIRLVDFSIHLHELENEDQKAISRTRYGYDDTDEDEDDEIGFEDIFPL